MPERAKTAMTRFFSTAILPTRRRVMSPSRFSLTGSTTSSFRAWGALAGIAIALTEGAALLGLAVLERSVGLEYAPKNQISDEHVEILSRLVNDESTYYRISPSLGWEIHEFGSDDLYRANSAGIRSDREYTLEPPDEVVRIAAFGDSFTHGDDVDNESTWSAMMESLSPELEVINFGVGGYGLDQAYLRYLEIGRQYGNQIVLIGFMSENINRNVNRFRPFYFRGTGMPLGKPRFQIDGDDLALLENPLVSPERYESMLMNPEAILADAGEQDFFYRQGYETGAFDWSRVVRLVKISVAEYRRRFSAQGIIEDRRYNESSEAFQVTTRLFDEFYSQVQSDGAVPIIVLFPQRVDLVQNRDAASSRYSPLVRHFASESYEFIDLIDALGNHDASNDFDALFEHGHYTPFGNQLVAEYILDNVETASSGFSPSVAAISE